MALSKYVHETIKYQEEYVNWIDETRRHHYKDFMECCYKLVEEKERLRQMRKEAGVQPASNDVMIDHLSMEEISC